MKIKTMRFSGPTLRGAILDTTKFEDDVAKEVAEVGIFPTPDTMSIGHRFPIGTQPFVVTGVATRNDFLRAVAASSIDDAGKSILFNPPAGLNFYRVTTD